MEESNFDIKFIDLFDEIKIEATYSKMIADSSVE
jgi:hypothetical protein